MIFMFFLFLAGASDAAKDTLAYHFSTSVFRKLNKYFWNPEFSWNGSKILRMRFDGWHLFKMLYTLFICLSIVFYKPQFGILIHDFILVYAFYKFGFNLFYSVILRRYE